jgi:hypothetical protein
MPLAGFTIVELTNLFEEGNCKLAIVYYDKALAIHPKNTDAIDGKQKALSDLNQTE